MKIKIGKYELEVPDGSSDGPILESVLLRDEYLLEPIRKSGRWLQTIVDVGANVGAFVMAANRVFPGSRIEAFEPNENTYGCLYSNCRDISRGLHQVALSNETGEGFLVHCDDHPAGDYLENEHGWKPNKADGFDYSHQKKLMVQVDRLSSFWKALGWGAVDLLKLDCEGSEADVLEDLKEHDLLDRVRWIRFEWHGKGNRERVHRALAETHNVESYDPGPGFFHGFGHAWHKLD